MKHVKLHSRTWSASLLALVILTLLPSCGNEARPSRPGAAGLQIHLVFQEKSAASTAGTASVQTIRVSAWEVPGGATPRVLRGSTSATIAAGDTRFRLELQIPPAALYLLQVEAEGILGTPANPTRNGLLFLGSENIADVVAGETRSVEIVLHRTVPVLVGHLVLPEGQVVPTGLSLSWGQVAGALGYRLLETPSQPSIPRETFTLRNDTLISFPPRAKQEAREQRTYRVRAELPDSLFSAYSESVGVSVPEPVAPAGIEDLVVVGASAAEIRLAWTATGDDQRVGRARVYDLRRSDSPITTEDAFAAAIRIAGLPAPGTSAQRDSFTVTELLPATDYYFAIKAADDVPLWSPLSNTARGTTLPLPPAAPQDLAAEALSETAIHLHWTDLATNETLYRIERRSPTDPRFVLADTMNGSFTGTVEYQDSNLIERTTYRYRVRAENPGGVSAWSNEISQRTRVAPPRDLAAVAVAPDSVALTWSFPFPDPADGFRLQRRTGSAGLFVEVGRPAAADRAFGDGGVQPLTTYAYRLRAADARDLSDWSDSAAVTTLDLPPVCRVEPAALAFDTVSVGLRLDRTFTITNTGGGRLTGRIPLTCPPFRVATGGGGFSLGAGESLLVVVRFLPTSPGTSQCSIAPTDACAPIVCSGTGEALPACVVDPPTLAFGTVALRSVVDRTFTITNSGGGVLSGDVAVSCDAFSVVSGGGAFDLRAGHVQKVTIRFSPNSPGAALCDVTPTGGCASVTCSGTGEALPRCSVSPTSLDFGTVPVGTDSVRAFTITNIGGGTLSGSVGADCSDYVIDGGGGAFSLGAGQPRVVTIRFTPSVEQPAGCTVFLGTTGCSSVSCTGAGEAHPVCSLNPTSLDFGVVPIGASLDRSFTITNTGGGKLAGTVAIAASCADFTVLSGEGAFALDAGASLPVTVRFTPQRTAPSSCPVTFGLATNSGCPDLPCTGTGLGPVCVVSPTALDFGSIQAGERATRTFALTNTGGGVLTGTVLWLTCAGSDFSIEAGGGTYSLGPGVSRTVTVAYAPSAAGVDVCQLATGCADAVSCTGTCPDPNDRWWPGFFGDSPNGPVSTLALHGSNLAVGGNFMAVGDLPTGSVAWWNGSAWTTSADFTTWTEVDALQAWKGSLGNGSLVAAGFAHEFGGTATAQWQNGTWVFLGGAFDGAVKTLASLQDRLFVGGDFTDPAAGLARWNGTSWEAADQGLAGASVNDLEVFGGTLYAAGTFVFPSGAAGAIFRLNGSSWTIVSNSLNGVPLASAEKLATHAGALYAIVAAGAGSSVVRIDGTTLVSVGDADDGVVVDITSDGTRLYAVGTFARLGGVVAERVAAWDGSIWHALGSGISGGQAYPKVVLSFGGSIYVGGDFATAGGKDSPYIARWIP